MSDDSSKISKILQKLEKEAPSKQRRKVNASVYIYDDTWTKFKRLCKARGVNPSHLADELFRIAIDEADSEGVIPIKKASGDAD